MSGLEIDENFVTFLMQKLALGDKTWEEIRI